MPRSMQTRQPISPCIDDVMNALSQLLAESPILIVSRCLSREQTERRPMMIE